VLSVEVEDRAEALVARLQAAGYEALADGRRVHVSLRDESTYDTVRDSVVDLGLALVRLERRRQSLEDIFRREEERDDAVA
jgi:ABC-2 type transport system ATP-binding protein